MTNKDILRIAMKQSAEDIGVDALPGQISAQLVMPLKADLFRHGLR